MKEISTTESAEHIESLSKSTGGDGLPEKLSLLRQKLSQKAKQEPNQMATLLILEPIFEADFEDCSYGFRPGRSAHQALEEIAGKPSRREG